MSAPDFDKRDRADHRQGPDKFDGRKWTSRDLDPAHGRLRFMSGGSGYVMVRKPGFYPFILTEKEWLAQPLFAPLPSGEKRS